MQININNIFDSGILSLAIVLFLFWFQEGKMIPPKYARYIILIVVALVFWAIARAIGIWAEKYWYIFVITFIVICTLLVFWIRDFTQKESKKIIKEKGEENVVSYSKIYADVLGISGKEPTRKPSKLSNAISTVASIIILAYGISMAYLVIEKGLIVVHDLLFWVAFFVIFFLLPVYVLFDTWVCSRKYYRLGHSAKEQYKKIILGKEINEAFNLCFEVVRQRIGESENSRIFTMQRPSIIKSLIGKWIITIEINKVKDNIAEIFIKSDNQWVTVKWDFGTNQKNIEKLEYLILKETINKEGTDNV